MNTLPKQFSPRHKGRMLFKQTVDKAVAAFIRSPEGKALDYDAFDPKSPDLRKQRGVLATFVKFLAEHS